MRLLHLTDLHLYADAGGDKHGFRTWASLRRLLAQLQAHRDWPPTRLILGGDLSEDGSEASYRALAERLEALGVPTVAVPGNHDVPEHFERYIASAVRPVEVPGWRLILADSRVEGAVHGELGAAQRERIAAELTAAGAAAVLVVLHHHPVAMGSAWIDALGLRDARELRALLEAREATTVVLCGHVHQSHDRSIAGVRYLATPSTCYQFAAGRDDWGLDPLPPAARWIELRADGAIRTELVWAEPATELEAARAG